MNPTNSQNEVSLHAVDYWQVIRCHYGVVLLTLFLVFMTSAVITYLMPKQYESVAKIEVKPRERTIDPLVGVAGLRQSSSSLQFLATEFEKIKSRNSLSGVVDDLDLGSKWGMEHDDAVSKLQSIINVQAIRGTDMITIKARHTNKDDAKDIAKAVSDSYKKYREDIETSTLNRGVSELKRAVQEQEDKVTEKRKTLTTISRTKDIVYYDQNMSRNSGFLDEDTQSSNALMTFTEIENELMVTDAQIKSLLNYSSEQLLVYASGLDLPDNIIKTLYPDYLEQKRTIEAMKANGLGVQHPTIISSQKLLDQTKLQLDEGVVNLRLRLQGQLEMLKDRLGKAEIRKDSKKKENLERSIDTADYVDAKRDYEAERDILENMKMKLLTEEIGGQLPMETIVVHETPLASNQQVSPKVALNLTLGAIVGLIFGFGIAFFLEYMDSSVKSIDDVEKFLQLPVLAVVPQGVGILYNQNGVSPDAEAYRILRTNIEFNRKNPEDNAISVVSGAAGEGKSTTMMNLGYVCAQGGYTTLLIDADLRRPTLHKYFDVDNSVGLSNYLTTDMTLEEVIMQSNFENLFFMPSGKTPDDPSGILNSRRMSDLLSNVKQRFDLILVDSPPIIGVSDASVIASEVDQTMIVIQHRKIPRNILLRVKKAVESVGGKIIGVVMNNVDIRSDSQYQYYTSYYTYYSPDNKKNVSTKNQSDESSASVEKEQNLY